ncbi:MAG: hypothetical protein ACYC7E_16745 [Armatimonadota bacterium]
MTMKRFLPLLAGLLLAGACFAWQQVNTPLPDVMPYYPKWPVNRATWTMANGVLQAESKVNAWSYYLQGNPADRDYTFSYAMLIPAMAPDRTEYYGHYPIGYRPGEFEPCWETCAVVRYVDAQHFYRVMFGWLAGDIPGGQAGAVALWSPDGGFLQVKPYNGNPFTWQQVKIAAAGPVITVWLDGKPVIHYKDTVAPIQQGKYGLGAFGDQFYRFKEMKQSPNSGLLPDAQAIVPGKEAPRFRLAGFLRQQFLFCNNEPIGRIDPVAPFINEVRLRPGYRPQLSFGLHWDQYNRTENFVNIPEEWVVEKTDGPEFVARYRLRNTTSSLAVNGRLRVTYDAKRGSYLWEVDTTVEVLPGKTWVNDSAGLSFGDPVPYDHVPNAFPQAQPWRAPYQWIVFQAPDGKYYRHPLYHNYIPPTDEQMRIKSDGGIAVLMDNPYSNPGIQLDFPEVPGQRAGFWVCPWIYDIHFLISPYKHGQTIPGGTKHHAKFRYLTVYGEEAKRMMAESTVHPHFKTVPPRILFTGGVNTFDRQVTGETPHAGYPWGGGEWDQQSGHADHFSLRLKNEKAGKRTIHIGVGGSVFMGRFDSRRYRITGWVRTDGVTGKGAALFAQNGGHTDYSAKRLTGTSAWQRLSLETELLYGILGANIGLELDGAGAVWLDDFELTPLR